MTKKLIFLLMLIGITNSTLPHWGRWGGGFGWGGPYYGSPYGYYGYSPAADIIGTTAAVGLTAAALSNRPKSDAEIDYQREKDIKRELKRARKKGDSAQIARLEKELAKVQG